MRVPLPFPCRVPAGVPGLGERGGGSRICIPEMKGLAERLPGLFALLYHPL